MSDCFDELARKPLFDDSRLRDPVRDPIQELRDDRAPVRRGEVRQHFSNHLAHRIPPRHVAAVKVGQLALLGPGPARRERLEQAQARIGPELILRDDKALRGQTFVLGLLQDPGHQGRKDFRHFCGVWD